VISEDIHEKLFEAAADMGVQMDGAQPFDELLKRLLNSRARRIQRPDTNSIGTRFLPPLKGVGFLG